MCAVYDFWSFSPNDFSRVLDAFGNSHITLEAMTILYKPGHEKYLSKLLSQLPFAHLILKNGGQTQSV
jgi:hypothetical protein